MSLDDLEKLIDAAPKDAPHDRAVVVVVDDDPMVRSSLESVLSDEYLVRTCKNAVEAIRTIDDETDCVILDVKMPGHDGFWVAAQLRSGNQDVPIIFHSGYQNVKDPYEVINEFRPFGYVVKGDTLAVLLNLVAQAVRQSSRVRSGRRTVERLRDARETLKSVHDQLGGASTTEPDRRSEAPAGRK